MVRPTLDDNPEARRRLAGEAIIWLTTVRGNGQPQTSPVWFLALEDEVLIYSLPDTARVANVEANPRVALNLDGNGRGGAIVTLEGRARIDHDYPSADRVPAYVDKYRDFMARNGWTPEVFAARYSTPLRVSLTRSRAW
jgi:PPOX class probable F420-dependent enzyme